MNYLLSIEQATTLSDGVGGQTVSWAEQFTWWADVRMLRGQEQERLGRLASVEAYELTGRFDDRITAKHRVNFAGKILNIRAALDRDGKRRQTVVEAEAGVQT